MRNAARPSTLSVGTRSKKAMSSSMVMQRSAHSTAGAKRADPE
jgi:hypothetical protein